jgi:hypothetical protein
MPHYIKTGFWITSAKKYNDYLDLDRLITSTIGPLPNILPGANISITGIYPDLTINVVGFSGGSAFTVFNLN